MIVKDRPLGEGPVILPRSSNGTEPQHLLLALLGDYWFERQDPVPSAAMLDLLVRFGVKESSARQAMRRLALKGHLVHHRTGRTTSYGFPARSERVIRARLRNVIGFGQDGPAWDERFTVVAFSIPEEQRDQRRELRTQLLSLGFGNLYDAVWISPRDEREDALALLRELDVPRASVFYGPEAGMRDAVTMVSEAFDTQHVRDLYEEFIAAYGPMAESTRPVEDALVTRTLMVNKWLTLRTVDPNLPLELLPSDWPRARAHKVFLALYDRLGSSAAQEFRTILERHDPDLGPLVTHYTSAVLES